MTSLKMAFEISRNIEAFRVFNFAMFKQRHSLNKP